jgi:YD repeat-containing protein
MNGVTVDYGCDNIGQLASAQGHEADSTLRLNENLAYTYDASGNLASRTQNTLLQTFSTDPADQLTGITRSGTLTVDGSFSGAVATLGVNGQSAALYSDGTFATVAGLTLHDGNNLFVTAGSNAAGALVLSTVNATRLPVSTVLTYDKNGNLLSDGRKVYAYDDANQLVGVSVPGEWKAEFVYDGLLRRRIVATRSVSHLVLAHAGAITSSPPNSNRKEQAGTGVIAGSVSAPPGSVFLRQATY